MTHGKTYNKSPRRINHKATKSKTNTETTALERSVEQTTCGGGGLCLKHFYSYLTSPWVLMLLLIQKCLKSCLVVLIFVFIFQSFEHCGCLVWGERGRGSSWCFSCVWFCLCPLPLRAWDGLRLVIGALPGLFPYLFRAYAGVRGSSWCFSCVCLVCICFILCISSSSYVWGGLRLVIVALPGLFSYLYRAYAKCTDSDSSCICAKYHPGLCSL